MLIKFSNEQFDKLGDIFADIGAICFASVVLPAFIEKFNPLGGLVGLFCAGFFWYTSLIIIKQKS